jgi:hypothetical protein
MSPTVIQRSDGSPYVQAPRVFNDKIEAVREVLVEPNAFASGYIVVWIATPKEICQKSGAYMKKSVRPQRFKKRKDDRPSIMSKCMFPQQLQQTALFSLPDFN